LRPQGTSNPDKIYRYENRIHSLPSLKEPPKRFNIQSSMQSIEGKSNKLTKVMQKYLEENKKNPLL